MKKPTEETARETMKRLGLHPDRWGSYRVGEYRFRFKKRVIRIERTFRHESGRRGSIHTRSYFYSRLVPGQLEGLVKLLTDKGGQNHGEEKSDN